MNFISRLESAQVQVELKYCERCGGLFLRPQAGEVVYCNGCTADLAARSRVAGGVNGLAAPTRGARKPRMAKGPKLQKHELHGTARIEYLEGVAAREVRA